MERITHFVPVSNTSSRMTKKTVTQKKPEQILTLRTNHRLRDSSLTCRSRSDKKSYFYADNPNSIV